MSQRVIFLMLLVLSFGFSSVSAQTETQPAMPTRPVSKGVVNGSAISLPKPAYPAAAKAVKAGGAVNVQVLIDEGGNVIEATAVSGHPLLRQAAEQAASEAKFKPTILSGQAVKASGVIVYNFVAPMSDWTNVGHQFGVAEIQGIRAEINLPEEFAEEKSNLISLIKLSPQEQTGEIANTISTIKSRLNPTDLWHFEFGLAKGKILTNAENDNIILENLARIRNLADSLPEGVQSYDTVRAGKLAKFADKESLTKEDKEAIFRLLR